MDDHVLSVRGLKTHLRTRAGMVAAVDGVDFDIGRGETLALLGESGCGKSLTALSLMGLLPARAGAIACGEVRFAGKDLLTLDDAALRHLRGARMAMVFQEPMSSLNPVRTVGSQVAEVFVRHAGLNAATARTRTVGLLRDVGIHAPDERYDRYPHELSGGTCQRVMIAMALACGPELLIADEPTTALDVTVQQQILDLIDRLRARSGMAVLLITHDLGVVAENADRVAVMYLGKIVEQAPAARLFAAPAHPYTHGLLAALPGHGSPGVVLPAIPGSVPDLADRPPGCGFAPRCARAQARCHVEMPALQPLSPGRAVRCWCPLGEAT
jgi:oligopeptide/dipeptide ABC transporter ATP-binding protein